MRVKCIENRMHNGNFTLNKIYEVKKNIITCDFIHILLKEPLKIKDGEFEFAFCKFQIME